MIDRPLLKRLISLIFTFVTCLIATFGSVAGNRPETATDRKSAMAADTRKGDDSMAADVDMSPATYQYYRKCMSLAKDAKVLPMLDTLYNMAGKEGDKRTQAVALCQKAMYYYFTESNHDSLRSCTKRVQSFALDTDQPRYYFWIWMRYAEYYMKQRKYHLALLELDAMERDARELNCAEGFIDAYKVMARIYGIRKNYQMAEEMQKKALNLLVKTEDADKFNLSDAYTRLASFQIGQEKYKEAGKNLEKAEAAARTDHQRLLVLSQLSSLYTALKDEAKLRATIAEVEKIDNFKTDGVLMMARYDLASLNGDYQEMEKQVLALRENRYIFDDEYYRKMADVLSHIPGREREALGFYEKYTAFNDSLNKVDSDGRIEEFTTILNLHENEIEKKQMEVKLESEKNKSLVICLSASVVLALILLIILFRQMRRQTSQSREITELKERRDSDLEKDYNSDGK